VSIPGRAGKIQKSEARAQWQQSTVPVGALHHHAELQARRHYRGIGVLPKRTEPLCLSARACAPHGNGRARRTIFARPGEPEKGSTVLSWDDADSGALFCPDVGRIGEPCPTLIIGLMVGMMRPLNWDDVDSGAPTIERVDRICDPQHGLIIGLTVGVMRPLGRAFTRPLILDSSVRWLAPSPVRGAPGRDSVRWLISRTGSGRRQFYGEPGELPR
jgi:hypothetical protein